MATLYVTEVGARIEKAYQTLLVTKEDEVLLSVPLMNVSQVVLVGNVGVTTPALVQLLEQGIDLTLVNSMGKLRGRLIGPRARNVALRQAHYRRAADPAFCLAISRAIVQGKLQNYQALCLRLARARNEPTMRQAAAALDKSIGMAAAAGDLAALRGVEGSGSKIYFGVLRAAFRQSDMGFQTRARRPPPDPINALLSLAYTLLTENLYAALTIVGLDPHDGFYHADAYGRPALALDLMEEFRAIVADSVVLSLVNKRVLDKDDFRPGDDGGIMLKEHGLRRFLHHYSQRLQTVVLHPLVGRKLSYQKCFEVQARQLRKVIEGSEAEYRPFRTR